MAYTLAYYDTATITAVKSFIVQAPAYFAKESLTKKKIYWVDTRVAKRRVSDVLATTSTGHSITKVGNNAYRVRLLEPGNTIGESITVPLASCLIGLESAADS